VRSTEPPSFATEEVARHAAPAVRGFSLAVVEGAPAARCDSTGARCGIGSHPLNDLVVEDGTVSRFHCELTAGPGGVRLRDLGSRNGVVLDGVRVHDAELRDGSLLRLGRAVVRFTLDGDSHVLSLSRRESFGGLVGTSTAMRSTFAVLERAAASDATVLLEGETGTGKGAMAEAIHGESARRDRPLVVVDCGALSPTLLDSELFGHERGAFTGADVRRIGAFEEADGGTVFLDEIGELPAELQPKLLRVLESREIRRLGQNGYTKVDFRIVSATNRDLRAEVNAGRFRSDLYYRLAVLKVAVPPLRQRPEDIAAISRAILMSLRATPAEMEALTSETALARLGHAAWPGNVRELRNYLERSLVLQTMATPIDGHGHGHGHGQAEIHLPYTDARKHAIDRFERAYVEGLLRAHKGKVAATFPRV
jgi:transcriptional regulator with GAF, ATPase, and Fis domain